jgi:hypothetical protein
MKTLTLQLQSDLYALERAEDHQKSLYEGLRKNPSWLGRCRAPFLPIREVCIEVVAKPVAAIEAVAKSAMNLFCSRFYEGYSVKNSLFYLERAISHLIDTPLTALMTPFQYIHQVFAVLFYPKVAQSLHEPAFIAGGGSKKITILRQSKTGYSVVQSGISNLAGSTSRRELHRAQQALYMNCHLYSPFTVRCLSPFLATFDVLLDVMIPVSEVVKNIFCAGSQLLGAAFQLKCPSLKNILYFTSKAHTELSNAAAATFLSPIKLVYQIISIVCNPNNPRSIAGLSAKEEIETFWQNKVSGKLAHQRKEFIQTFSVKILQKIFSNNINREIHSLIVEDLSPEQLESFILSVSSSSYSSIHSILFPKLFPTITINVETATKSFAFDKREASFPTQKRWEALSEETKKHVQTALS